MFNIGTDIVYIPKMAKMYQNNQAFFKKIYTEKENIIAHNIKNPINFYATRFAAKEAIIKATKGQFDFNEIEILKDDLGAPQASIINNPDYIINLSLSYDNDYAIAFCQIQKK